MSWNPLSWAAHQIDNTCEPKYRVLQKRLRDKAAETQLFSQLGLVASFVTLFFGMSKNDSAVVFMSVALGYYSYNMYYVSENYYKIAANPNDFDAWFGWSELSGEKKLDNSKLKACLGENTFYFGIFVDSIVNHVIELMSNKKTKKVD